MSIVLDLLKSLQIGLVCIEDSFYDEIVGFMFEDTNIESVSAVEVHRDSNPDTRIPGKRAIAANIQSTDNLEKIVAAFIEAYTLSLRLQRSGQDNQPINRNNLNTHIRNISPHMNAAIEWHDSVMKDSSKTNDYKLSVKDSYRKCKEAIDNFNDYVTNKVNKAESDVIFTQPDDPLVDVLILQSLPPR